MLALVLHIHPPLPENTQFSHSWEAPSPMQTRQISSQVPKILRQTKNQLQQQNHMLKTPLVTSQPLQPDLRPQLSAP
jgi:hypothetical protein